MQAAIEALPQTLVVMDNFHHLLGDPANRLAVPIKKTRRCILFWRLKLGKIMFAETDVTLRVANGKIVRPKGRCTLKLNLNGLEEKFDFLVMEDCSHDVTYKQLSILQCNINGLCSTATKIKLEEIMEIAEKQKIQIIALQETKLNEKYNLKYKNYNILRKDRNKEGGGLAFLIKNLYYEDIAINIPNTSDLEAQGIKNFKKANWNLYQQNTNEDFRKAPTRIKDLEQNWISFKNTIIKAAKVSIPRDYALENTDLNKTPGADGIHDQMISNLGKNGKERLLDIFNNSRKTGKLPQDWKTATIIPIKKLDKSADDPKNYRPISLTSICCRLMEKIILRQLTYHLYTRNLLPEEQYGFRKGHGTIDQLLFFTQKVKDAQNRKQTNHTIAAFLDLTQAFDKVWKNKLITKYTSISKLMEKLSLG
ncbi:hypothetical protein LAZ67_8001211 [Cordylochernes scorpioides]|uniref:Reverse transcriptase domain-containing protein n=1 Tax=Cordylochernes scorpioides TaxID=51811 RepID=A0ABY6KV19_9ARAC|nr:hypothetical protein LAZ67_8001211 [Cordylochernes scorpioides]